MTEPKTENPMTKPKTENTWDARRAQAESDLKAGNIVKDSPSWRFGYFIAQSSKDRDMWLGVREAGFDDPNIHNLGQLSAVLNLAEYLGGGQAAGLSQPFTKAAIGFDMFWGEVTL